MDLSTVHNPEELATMELRHPVSDEVIMHGEGDEQRPMTITIYGTDSQHVRNVQRAQQDRRLQKAQRMGRVNATAEAIEASTLEILAKSIKDWDITVHDEQPDYSQNAAIALLKEFPWIREQVDNFMSDRANFTRS